MTPSDDAGTGAETPVEYGPARHLSVGYVVMVTVAIMVGAGIFRAPAEVARYAGSATALFAVWLAGAAIALAGALCYAELASAFPHAGGDYQFLKLAWGRGVAFLFGWARFAVINSGSIALLAFVLGDYANLLVPLGAQGPTLYAGAAVLALTLFNLKGLHTGVGLDYAMTGLEVGGLFLIIGAGVLLALMGVPAVSAGNEPATAAGFSHALLFVVFAYSGFNEVATLSAEIADARRGMLRALVLAILTVAVLYLAVNWALWRGLGQRGLAGSVTPASDLIGLAFGNASGTLSALAIIMATLTSINATIIVGARTTWALATDWAALRVLSRWDGGRGVPLHAVAAQGVIALLLVGLGAWSRDGFSTLIDYTSPIFWGFLTLSAGAVLRLRHTHAATPRPFTAPLGATLPLVLGLTSLFVCYSSVAYVRRGALAGLAVLALGGLVLCALKRSEAGGGECQRYGG